MVSSIPLITNQEINFESSVEKINFTKGIMATKNQYQESSKAKNTPKFL